MNKLTPIFQKTLEYISYLIIGLTPFVVSSGAYAPYSSSKLRFVVTGIGISLILFAIKSLNTKEKIFSNNKVWKYYILLGIFPLVLMVSSIVSPDWKMAFFSESMRSTGLILLISLYLYIPVIIKLVHTVEKYTYKVLNILFSASVLVAFLTFFTFKNINIGMPFLTESNGGATLGNSSFAGTFFVITLFIGLFLYFNNKTSSIAKKYYIGGIILTLSSPVLFNSDIWRGLLNLGDLIQKPYLLLGWARMAVVSIVAGVVVTWLIYHILKPNTKIFFKKIAIGTLISIGLTIGYLGYKLVTPNNIINKFFIEQAMETRILFWNSGIEGFFERPILGWGHENYSIVFHKYFSPKMLEPQNGVEAWNDRAHNIIVELLTTGGMFGFLAYLLIIIVVIKLAIINYKNNNINSKQVAVIIGLIVAYILQNLFVFDTVTSYTILAILIAVLLGSTYNKEINNDTNTYSFYVFRNSILIILGSILLFFSLYSLNVGNNQINILRNSNDVIERVDTLTKIVKNPLLITAQNDLGLTILESYKNYYKNISVIISDESAVRGASYETDSLINLIGEYLIKSPNDYLMSLNGIRFCNINIVITKSLDPQKSSICNNFAERSLILAPNDPQMYWSVGEYSLYKQDFESAKKYFYKALSLNPKIKDSHFYVVNFEQSFGTYDGLKKAIEDAEKALGKNIFNMNK